MLLLQECIQHGAAQAWGAPVHWTDQHTDAAPSRHCTHDRGEGGGVVFGGAEETLG